MQAVSSTVLSTVLWASLSTLLVMCLAIPLGYALARYDFPGKRVLATLTSLPLVLPPTAVGYLLLKLLADNGPLGFLDVLLTWKGVIIACAVMSLPLALRTARVSFEAVNPRLEAMARTLGRSRAHTFLSVTIPLASRGLLAATILGFTRAMGEFGATIIVAGNIPGQTQTLASAIYSAQQSGNDHRATMLLSVALAVGFAAVFLSEWLARPQKGGAR